MIEINLVPNVKQELIKAQRQRSTVITLAILTGAATVGIVIILAIWVFGVQATRGLLSDNTIKTESAKLATIEDLSNTLTIQNQLAKLSDLHNSKSIDSRIFDVLSTINPPTPNTIQITTLALDASAKTITMSAQASNGYPALETFRKTINATRFEFTQGGQKQSVPLASNLTDGDRTYGDDSDSNRVLRFTISFTYPDLLFSRKVQNAVVTAPTQSNATDSFLGVPTSLFTQKAADAQGGN